MKAATTLTQLKQIDWSKAEASLWAIFFEGKGEDAPVTLRPINTTERLQSKLREILVGQIKRAQSVQPYAYETADLDDEEALVITNDRDQLKAIVTALNTARMAKVKDEGAPVSSIEEILSAAGYLIRLDAPLGEVVHGFKRMPESVGTRKKLFEVVFDRIELDEEEKPERFRLSKVVDAFHFDGTSFILSKRDFESGLRYREAMRMSAKAAVDQIVKAGVLHNAKDLLKSGEHKFHLLRRLAGIGKHPRFTDPAWLKKVRELNTKHRWGLNFTDSGQLLLDDRCLNLILTLLRDRRAVTMIFGEVIDADVARIVEAAGVTPQS